MAVDEALIPRRYGFPFSGFVSTRRKQLIDLHAISGDSRDVLVSPNEGQLRRRLGMSYVNESDMAAPTGMLEGLWGSTSDGTRSSRVQAPFAYHRSDGTTNPAAFVGSDGSVTGAVYGTLMVYDPVDANEYNFGKEFGSTHYPTSSNAGGCNFKMVPLPYLTPDQLPTPGPVTSTSVGYTRCANLLSRRFIGCGSWAVHSGPDRTLVPSLYGTPFEWNNRYNKATGSGSEVLRCKPWGHYPPLFPPFESALHAASGSGDAQWQDGDTFYVSQMFQFEDGSFSKPFQCRPVSAVLDADHAGLVTIGTVGGVDRYRTVDWGGLAIGPPGTRTRLLLRTAKVTLGGVASDPVLPDPSGPFYIFAVIENNTQTEYYGDAAGNDTLLRRDDLAVRTDGIWPPASRTVFEFERRVGVGFSRKNPSGIIIAPIGKTALYDLNVSDTAAAAYGQQAMLWRIVQSGGTTTLQLRRVSGASWPAAPGTTSITINATTTLQDIVDQINATATGANGYAWRAALAPGTDGNIPSTMLQPTCTVVTGCTTTDLSPAIAGDFTDIAIGTCISGAGIPANAAIGSKNGNTSASMVNKTTGAALAATATGVGTVTLTFFADTGDDGIVNDSTTGNIRAYCPAFPGVIALRGSYLDTIPLDRRSVYFTAAPPGQAASATQSFFNSQSNRQGVPTSAGAFLAGAPIGKRAVLVYTGGVFILDNQRGGTTGEDFDFHPYVGNARRGGISILSVVAGNGWVGYMTRDGYIVADVVGDNLRERLLTADNYDPGQSVTALRGVLASMVTLASQTPQPDRRPFVDLTPFCTAVLDKGALTLLYQTGSAFIDGLVYDYRTSIEGSGLQQVLRSVGADELSAQTYGWSAQQTMPLQHLIGPVYTDKTYGFVDCKFLASVANPSAGEVTMVELGAHIGRDDIFAQIIQSNLGASSNQLTATFAGGFKSVAIGARITGHANINAAATVLAKTADGSTITMSHVSTNGSPLTAQSVTFTGKEVEPVAYFAMDSVESLRMKKCAHRGTALYRVQSGEELYVGVARDRARASRVTMLLPNSGADDNTRDVVEVPIRKRTAGEVVEFSIEGRNASRGASLASGGYPAEFWGLDAEVELVDSQV